MPCYLPDLDHFARLAGSLDRNKNPVVPIFRRLTSDQVTPVLAYRRLVRPDDRMAPSFLFESVVGGERVARYSYLGAQPAQQVIARGRDIRFIDSARPEKSRRYTTADPLREMDLLTKNLLLAPVPDLPEFTGGWVGFAGYDAVRYLEGEKLPSPPPDDRRLPDLHLCLYRQIVAFDHVQKTILIITNVFLHEYTSLDAAYAAGRREIDDLAARVQSPPNPPPGQHELPPGEVDLSSQPPPLPVSNMGVGGYQKAVEKAKTYIAAGDVFQVVPSQRFELRTKADPFDVYRALRIVNPSPYMFYLQIQGAVLVGSSPEILCKVHNRIVTNRPLAGTRRRGLTQAQDAALEAELLADPKERAEHVMLLDLGRNDVGRVAVPGSIQIPDVMTIERYSHVMHISSTVTGRLRDDCSCWDALRVILPVGTVSGAPKVRAMQIIDELEPTRRGPYAGAVGYADLAGNMDMAIALRTMVILPPPIAQSRTQEIPAQTASSSLWTVHIQAGGGIVADSNPDAEHQETVSKAAALAKAVDLAQRAFSS